MNLERFKFLGASRNFSASIGSFQGLPAGTSEVILLSQRLALKYNTTPRGSCQHFLTSFLNKIEFTSLILCSAPLPHAKRPSMHCTDGLGSIYNYLYNKYSYLIQDAGMTP